MKSDDYFLKIKNLLKFKRNNKAFTLIELVISMVVISVALIGTLLAFNTVTRNSGKPVIRSHELAIAESYLTEILTKNFPTVSPCPSPTVPREDYGNVCDYHNLHDIGAKDQQGIAISGLEKYHILVNVDLSSTGTFGGLNPGSDPTDPEMVRIDVSVWLEGESEKVKLSVYKSNYI